MAINKVRFLFIALGLIKFVIAYYIVSTFRLGDSWGYSRTRIEWSFEALVKRTDFVEFFYSFLSQYIFITPFLAGLIIAVYLSNLIFELTSRAVGYYQMTKYHFFVLIIFCLPASLLFLSVPGKEQFTLLALLNSFYFFDKYIDRKNIIFLVFSFFFLFLAVFVRSIIILPVLVTVSLLLAKFFPIFLQKILLLSAFIALICVYILFIYLDFDTSGLFEEIISRAKNYFSGYNGRTSRYVSDWETASDFFSHLPKGLFVIIFSVFPSEAFSDMIYFLVFISNIFLVCFIFGLFYHSNYGGFKVKIISIRAFIISCSFLAMFSVVYPFFYINIGTAIRYQQNIIVVLFVVFLLLKRSDVLRSGG